MDTYRAFVYDFLSVAFSYPNEELLHTLEKGLGDLAQSVQALGIAYDTAPLGPVLFKARQRLLDLQGEHNALFATSAKAPSWETAYEADKTARRVAELSDIEGFYRAFGMNLAAPIEADSLVAELEFLSVLLQKQMYARRVGNQEGVEVCEDAYLKFLTDHLGRWYQIFHHRLAEATEEDYYQRVGALLKAFLERETQGRGGEISKLSSYQEDSGQGSAWKCESQEDAKRTTG